MMLTAEQVAARFAVKPVTVRRWVLKGLLPAQKIAGALFFDPQDLEKFQKPNRAGGRPRKDRKISD